MDTPCGDAVLDIANPNDEPIDEIITTYGPAIGWYSLSGFEVTTTPEICADIVGFECALALSEDGDDFTSLICPNWNYPIPEGDLGNIALNASQSDLDMELYPGNVRIRIFVKGYNRLHPEDESQNIWKYFLWNL